MLNSNKGSEVSDTIP